MPEIRSLSLLRQVRTESATHGAFAARERFHREAIDLIERETLIAPAFSFRIAELDAAAADILHVDGETLYAPRLLPEAGELTGLACGVVTLGPALERRVTSLFAEKCYSLALALDDIGNQLLLAATRHAQDRMWAAARAQKLTMAGELRPGDPGLALQAQGRGAAARRCRLDRRQCEPRPCADSAQIDIHGARRRHRPAAGALVALRRLSVAQQMPGGQLPGATGGRLRLSARGLKERSLAGHLAYRSRAAARAFVSAARPLHRYAAGRDDLPMRAPQRRAHRRRLRRTRHLRHLLGAGDAGRGAPQQRTYYRGAGNNEAAAALAARLPARRARRLHDRSGRAVFGADRAGKRRGRRCRPRPCRSIRPC